MLQLGDRRVAEEALTDFSKCYGPYIFAFQKMRAFDSEMAYIYKKQEKK